MKVLLLGAGASTGAGYPLASQLLPSIRAAVANSPAVQLRDAWRDWCAFRDAATGPLQLVLGNPNPEVIFSLLDLYEAALVAHDDEELARAARELRKAIEGATIAPGTSWGRPERDALREGKIARNRLLDCLSAYFEAKHCDDNGSMHSMRRNHLRQLLARLEPDDAVVTLNWDTTVERTLAEDGRWHPTTGYGFTKELCIGTSPPRGGEPRCVVPPRKSHIRVLKLHGSTGWYSNQRGQLYFRHPSYLQCFPFEQPLVDPHEPPTGSGPPEGAVLMYPSYLKQLRGNEMQTIWQHAAAALANAQQVEIWGYSLPESDTAMRVLLNSLRFRLNDHDLEVMVHDPSEAVRERWMEFLGPHAHIDGTRL